jgi:hypothetical protein
MFSCNPAETVAPGRAFPPCQPTYSHAGGELARATAWFGLVNNHRGPPRPPTAHHCRMRCWPQANNAFSTEDQVLIFPLSGSIGWRRHYGRAVFSGDGGKFVDDPASAGAVPGQADLIRCYVSDGDVGDVGTGVERRHRQG